MNEAENGNLQANVSEPYRVSMTSQALRAAARLPEREWGAIRHKVCLAAQVAGSLPQPPLPMTAASSWRGGSLTVWVGTHLLELELRPWSRLVLVRSLRRCAEERARAS